jgi:electron transfer flavoprotein-quinone oxidoreductase
MEKFEAIVVGGGLAGLASAYTLAKEGIEVLLVERGDFSGAKNVTGGRLYINPIRGLLPELWKEAPFERFVGQETITVMGDNSSVSIKLSSDKLRQEPYHSYTILRAKFDNWFAEKAAEAGAIIVTKQKVDDIIKDNGKVCGIISGEDKIEADVVVAADGIMSLITERAQLREDRKPKDYAVGFKEIIELPEKMIEDRFNLNDGEGAAQMFMGKLTKGMFGGGFLYTNRASISLGMVIGISDIMAKQPPVEVPELLEEFKNNSEITPLLKGGESVEYSAHVISEGGYDAIPPLFDDGILVTGDAAGLNLNTGLTVRGMEFAIASGVFAAQTIKKAKDNHDYSKKSLSYYQQLMQDSFVLKDMYTFRKAPSFLENQRLFTVYPQVLSETLEKMMTIGTEPKAKLSATAMKEIRSKLGWSALKELRGVFKL